MMMMKKRAENIFQYTPLYSTLVLRPNIVRTTDDAKAKTNGVYTIKIFKEINGI